jgi:hypothetical protein
MLYRRFNLLGDSTEDEFFNKLLNSVAIKALAELWTLDDDGTGAAIGNLSRRAIARPG